MARTIDEAAHGLKRDAYLDAMERLLLTKGFAAATIADVLRETGSSKGALYHYFDSKTALLEGLQQRNVERLAEAVRPVLDSDEPALAKLDAFTGVMARWKSARREVLLAAARGWREEGNALPRERLRKLGQEWLASQLAGIIRQGCREGVFDAPDPDTAARLTVVILQDLQGSIMDWVLGRRPDAAERAVIDRRVDSYHQALERLLGAPDNSIHIVPRAALDEWFED